MSPLGLSAVFSPGRPGSGHGNAVAPTLFVSPSSFLLKDLSFLAEVLRGRLPS